MTSRPFLSHVDMPSPAPFHKPSNVPTLRLGGLSAGPPHSYQRPTHSVAPKASSSAVSHSSAHSGGGAHTAATAGAGAATGGLGGASGSLKRPAFKPACSTSFNPSNIYVYRPPASLYANANNNNAAANTKPATPASSAGSAPNSSQQRYIIPKQEEHTPYGPKNNPLLQQAAGERVVRPYSASSAGGTRTTSRPATKRHNKWQIQHPHDDDDEHAPAAASSRSSHRSAASLASARASARARPSSAFRGTSPREAPPEPFIPNLDDVNTVLTTKPMRKDSSAPALSIRSDNSPHEEEKEAAPSFRLSGSPPLSPSGSHASLASSRSTASNQTTMSAKHEWYKNKFAYTGDPVKDLQLIYEKAKSEEKEERERKKQAEKARQQERERQQQIVLQHDGDDERSDDEAALDHPSPPRLVASDRSQRVSPSHAVESSQPSSQQPQAELEQQQQHASPAHSARSHSPHSQSAMDALHSASDSEFQPDNLDSDPDGDAHQAAVDEPQRSSPSNSPPLQSSSPSASPVPSKWNANISKQPLMHTRSEWGAQTLAEHASPDSDADELLGHSDEHAPSNRYDVSDLSLDEPLTESEHEGDLNATAQFIPSSSSTSVQPPPDKPLKLLRPSSSHLNASQAASAAATPSQPRNVTTPQPPSDSEDEDWSALLDNSKKIDAIKQTLKSGTSSSQDLIGGVKAMEKKKKEREREAKEKEEKSKETPQEIEKSDLPDNSSPSPSSFNQTVSTFDISSPDAPVDPPASPSPSPSPASTQQHAAYSTSTHSNKLKRNAPPSPHDSTSASSPSPVSPPHIPKLPLHSISQSGHKLKQAVKKAQHAASPDSNTASLDNTPLDSKQQMILKVAMRMLEDKIKNQQSEKKSGKSNKADSTAHSRARVPTKHSSPSSSSHSSSIKSNVSSASSSAPPLPRTSSLATTVSNRSDVSAADSSLRSPERDDEHQDESVHHSDNDTDVSVEQGRGSAPPQVLDHDHDDDDDDDHVVSDRSVSPSASPRSCSSPSPAASASHSSPPTPAPAPAFDYLSSLKAAGITVQLQKDKVALESQYSSSLNVDPHVASILSGLDAILSALKTGRSLEPQQLWAQLQQIKQSTENTLSKNKKNFDQQHYDKQQIRQRLQEERAEQERVSALRGVHASVLSALRVREEEIKQRKIKQLQQQQLI